MSSNQAPSAGQKVHVHPAKNAPLKTEAPGSIESQSLAADSIRSGGAFTSNPNAKESNIGSGPTETPHASKPGSSGKVGANNPDSLLNQDSYAGTAPSYVGNAKGEFVSEESQTPKGRNLTEGGFAGSGTSGKGMPEPGSLNDPGRAALKGESNTKGGNNEGGVRRRDEQPFGALGGDTSA
ncbi:hypothetical protein V8F06_003315 [Rhypophila decipiens]